MCGHFFFLQPAWEQKSKHNCLPPCIGLWAIKRSLSFDVSLSSESLPTFGSPDTKDAAESIEVGWDCSELEFWWGEAGPWDLFETRDDCEPSDPASEEATEAVGETPLPPFRFGMGADITPLQWCRIDCLSRRAITSVLKKEEGSLKSKTFGGLNQAYPSASGIDT